MRRCEDVEPDLSAWLDGRLSDRAARTLQRHLRGCSPCTDEAQALRRARSLLRSAPVRQVPADLFSPESVGRRAVLSPQGVVVAEPTSAPRNRRPRTVVSAVAGVALLLAGMAAVAGQSDPMGPPTVPIALEQLSTDHTTLAGGPGVPAPVLLQPIGFSQ